MDGIRKGYGHGPDACGSSSPRHPSQRRQSRVKTLHNESEVKSSRTITKEIYVQYVTTKFLPVLKHENNSSS